MRQRFSKDRSMAPKYKTGQKVVIKPVKDQYLPLRDSGLEPYAGRIGEVIHYYWISPTRTEVFYIYTIRLDDDGQEVVLHEDELEKYVA